MQTIVEAGKSFARFVIEAVQNLNRVEAERYRAEMTSGVEEPVPARNFVVDENAITDKAVQAIGRMVKGLREGNMDESVSLADLGIEERKDGRAAKSSVGTDPNVTKTAAKSKGINK